MPDVPTITQELYNKAIQELYNCKRKNEALIKQQYDCKGCKHKYILTSQYRWCLNQVDCIRHSKLKDYYQPNEETS